MNLGYDVQATFENGAQALRHIQSTPPYLALLDVQMPGLCGLDIAEAMLNSNLKTKIIIYTMFTDYCLYDRAKEMGVDGYLLKEFATEDLKKCVKALEKNQKWYSPRLEDTLGRKVLNFAPDLYCKLSAMEKGIIKSIANKKTTSEIALEYFISPKTVESHRGNIIKKLKLPKKRNTLLIWALENKGFFSLVD